MPQTKLWIQGRNDGVKRMLQHIPIDHDNRRTEAGKDHFLMLLGDPATEVPQVQRVAKARIIHEKIEAAGLPE